MKFAEAIPAVRPEVNDPDHLRSAPTSPASASIRPRPARPDEAGAPMRRREAREPSHAVLPPRPGHGRPSRLPCWVIFPKEEEPPDLDPADLAAQEPGQCLRRLFQPMPSLTPPDLPPSREDLEVVGAFGPRSRPHPRRRWCCWCGWRNEPRERRPGSGPCPAGIRPPGGLSGGLGGRRRPGGPGGAVQVARRGRARRAGAPDVHLAPRVVRCGDGRQVESLGGPWMSPATGSGGGRVEDPRASPRWTAPSASPTWPCSATGPGAALACAQAFRECRRHGIIFPAGKQGRGPVPRAHGAEVDAPRACHRPARPHPSPARRCPLVASRDLRRWSEPRVLLGRRGGDGRSGRQNGGAPLPCACPGLQLEIYHGSSRGPRGAVGAYCRRGPAPGAGRPRPDPGQKTPAVRARDGFREGGLRARGDLPPASCPGRTGS